MRVLAVLPTRANVAQAVQAWLARLDPEDTLTVLLCSGSGVSREGRTPIYTLDRRIAQSHGWQRVVNAVFSRSPAVEEVFWNWRLYSVVLSRLWPTLLFHIRSFDPDVVDLRGMPGNRSLGRRALASPGIIVLSSDHPTPPQTIDTAWRRYDPSLKVSIILPVYNGSKYLRDAIEGVLRQTHRTLELIIVDDGSTDTTPGIIDDYARRDPRIVRIRNRQNLGLPESLNVGFAHATGELLTWTSADNIHEPDAVETLVRFLCTWTDIDFVYSDTRRIDESGRVVEEISSRAPPWALEDENVVGSSFLFRRKVHEALGGFRTDMKYVEDYEYWVRIYKRFRMMCLHRTLYNYRFHPDSLTSRVRSERRSAALRKEVQREHFG